MEPQEHSLACMMSGNNLITYRHSSDRGKDWSERERQDDVGRQSTERRGRDNARPPASGSPRPRPLRHSQACCRVGLSRPAEGTGSPAVVSRPGQGSLVHGYVSVPRQRSARDHPATGPAAPPARPDAKKAITSRVALRYEVRGAGAVYCRRTQRKKAQKTRKLTYNRVSSAAFRRARGS